MSTHLQAFIPDTDPDFVKHKNVLLACIAANVSLPKETGIYFMGSGYIQGYKGEVQMLDQKLEQTLHPDIHYRLINREGESGFEVDISKLPKGVSKLRFVNCY